MDEGKRIEWDDLDSHTRETAVRRLMWRTKVRRADAEDAVSEAVARLMRWRPIVRDKTELLTVAALNHLRGEHTRPANCGHRMAMEHGLDDPARADEARQVPDEMSDHATAIAEADDRSARIRELLRAITRLPPMDRSVLTAYYLEGRSALEIDEEHGDKPGTAKCRIHRARERLRAALRATDNSEGRSA